MHKLMKFVFGVNKMFSEKKYSYSFLIFFGGEKMF